MPYSAVISRANPTCLLFVIDQSHSMSEPFAGQSERSKAQGVADAINRLLQNLVLKCAKSDGIRDYFHVGVIGYGGKVSQQIAGAVVGQRLVPVSVVANYPIRIEEREKTVQNSSGAIVQQKFKFPIWFDAIATGKTPMCEAMSQVYETLTDFLFQHPKCFPPIVVHLTDGMPTDANPLSKSNEVRGLASSDGNVLLFNVHLSSKSGPIIAYPSDEGACPDEFARLLFRMSSELPPRLRSLIAMEGMPISAGARGFVFNADMISAVRFLDVGTRIATPLLATGKDAS